MSRDSAIKAFLDERKFRWLEKKLKTALTEEEKELFANQSEDIFSLDHWLCKAARKASQLSMASHPAKFSHPYSKTSPMIATAEKKADGFLRSGNSEADIDVFGWVAAFEAYYFLLLKLDDGKTVLEHLEQGSEKLRQELGINTASFEEIQESFLSIKKINNKVMTSDKVKQVYFPCEDGYHLLSVLTPSGLVFELKNRISEMLFSDQAKDARLLKQNNEYSDHGFDELFNFSIIGYGGTKPQNISVQNIQNMGKAYLLHSLPPFIQKKVVRLPREPFFTYTLWVGRFKENFNALAILVQQSDDSPEIRDSIDSTIRVIIDQGINIMWSIRNHEPGWSKTEDHSNLPLHQKIWLDNIWHEKRKNAEKWLNRIVEEFSQWIVLSHNKLQRDPQYYWGADDMPHIRSLVEQSREVLR